MSLFSIYCWTALFIVVTIPICLLFKAWRILIFPTIALIILTIPMSMYCYDNISRAVDFRKCINSEKEYIDLLKDRKYHLLLKITKLIYESFSIFHSLTF